MSAWMQVPLVNSEGLERNEGATVLLSEVSHVLIQERRTGLELNAIVFMKNGHFFTTSEYHGKMILKAAQELCE